MIFLRNLTKYFYIILLCSLVGCSSLGTYNPATGRSEFIMIPTSEEISMGESIHKSLQKKYKFSTNQKMLNRVNDIGRKVSEVSDRQDYVYRFFVIEEDSLNAFTTPGGYIYVHTGLLKKMTSDDEVAFVIAHEVGHCAAKHVIKKYQSAFGYNFIQNLILNQLSSASRAKQITSLSSKVLGNLIFSAYSRKDELEADRLGVKYSYLAGYDLKGAKDSFLILKENSQGSNVPQMLRSHPDLDQRILFIEQEIQKIKNNSEIK